MKHKTDEGFTLVELVVTMVILAILILGITFTYQSIVKMNNVSAKKDVANQLSSSLFDQISIMNYADIKESSLGVAFRFPSYIDSSNMVVENYVEDDENITFTLNHLEGNLSDFRIDFHLTPSGYALSNYLKFPLIEYLNNSNAFVINDRMDVTTWLTDAEGSLLQSSDLSRQYLSDETIDNSYDYRALLSFQTNNKSKLLKRYQDWAEIEGNELVPYEESPFVELELQEDDLYKIMKKNTVLEIKRNGTDIYNIVTVNIVYALDFDELLNLGGFFSFTGSWDELFDVTPIDEEYVPKLKYTIADKRYFELDNVYVLYWGTKCFSDSYEIKNTAQLPLNTFFVIETAYNAESIINGQFDDSTSVLAPDNLEEVVYSQGLNPTIDLASMYTNCTSPGVIDRSLFSDKYFVANVIKDRPSSIRMYDVNIAVYDNSGHLILNENRQNVLGK